jgi:uroporphyrinogen-III synthase
MADDARRDPGDGSTSLAGLTVVVVRSAEQPDPLVALLEERGARALVMPLVEVVDHAPRAEIEAALAPLTADDWVIVVSAHAARRVAGLLVASPARIAAVGATTAAALPRVDLVPPVQSAVGLLDAFAAPADGSTPSRAVVFQAFGGQPTLVEEMNSWGWQVQRVNTHSSLSVVPTTSQRLAALRADAVIFTSGSQAQAWVEALGTSTPSVVVTLGPQTRRNAEACGLKVDVVSADHSLSGAVRALQDFVKPH